LIHFEASRRLAALAGTEPDLEDIKRLRAELVILADTSIWIDLLRGGKPEM